MSKTIQQIFEEVSNVHAEKLERTIEAFLEGGAERKDITLEDFSWQDWEKKTVVTVKNHLSNLGLVRAPVTTAVFMVDGKLKPL